MRASPSTVFFAVAVFLCSFPSSQMPFTLLGRSLQAQITDDAASRGGPPLVKSQLWASSSGSGWAVNAVLAPSRALPRVIFLSFWVRLGDKC